MESHSVWSFLEDSVCSTLYFLFIHAIVCSKAFKKVFLCSKYVAIYLLQSLLQSGVGEDS